MERDRMFSENIKKEAIQILLNTPDCKMQRCYIKKKVTERLIAKNYLPKPYTKEQIKKSLDTTLSRVLSRLCVEKWFSYESRGPMQVYYSIPKTKQHNLREIMESSHVKQKLRDEFENIFKYATKEEMQQITSFLFSFTSGPRLEHLRGPEETKNLIETLKRIESRRFIERAKTSDAPAKIIEIGYRLLEEKPVSDFEKMEFYYFPTDVRDALLWVFWDTHLKYIGKKSFYELIRSNDPEYAKILDIKYTQLLKEKLSDDDQEKIRNNLSKMEKENPEYAKVVTKKYIELFGEHFLKD